MTLSIIPTKNFTYPHGPDNPMYHLASVTMICRRYWSSSESLFIQARESTTAFSILFLSWLEFPGRSSTLATWQRFVFLLHNSRCITSWRWLYGICQVIPETQIQHKLYRRLPQPFHERCRWKVYDLSIMYKINIQPTRNIPSQSGRFLWIILGCPHYM